MTKILIATVKPFAQIAVKQIRDILSGAGYQPVLLEKYGDQADLVNAVKDADALIIRSDIVDKQVIDAGDKLKIVVRAGAGYDNVDLKAATAKKVVVMNTPGQNSNAVAELAFGMMVYQIRNHFDGSPGKELRGKTLGLHAFGNVGKYMAHIARGFGMEVCAFDPFISEEVIKKSGVKPVSTINDLYSGCQYVSLHLPATEQTRKSINFDLLSRMPSNAVLVNTARKEVIDEEGLLKMFTERNDFCYLSDIAPDCKDEIVNRFPGRYLFTAKKMGAQTSEANINAGIAAANQIIRFLEKGDTTFKVN